VSGQPPPATSDRTNPPLPAVAHFIDTWLRASEPFVHDIISNLQHPGVVVSRLDLENVERFPVHPLRSLAPVCNRLPIRLQPAAVTAGLSLVVLRHRARLLHVHHGYRLHEAAGVARLLRLPLVVSLHGHDVTGYLEEHPQIYDGVGEKVAAAVVPSEFLKGLAIRAGFRPEAVQVIPSGVDTHSFRPSPLPEGPPVALFVGRFVEKKGLDVLLRAWPAVVSSVPDARLRLLGYGPLEVLARRAGPNVEVVSTPTHAEVSKAMRSATMVVSPSRTAPDDSVESLLIVNLEAQASGRPVVTTRHGGIPEFVSEGHTSLLVPENDEVSLARAMVDVLADRDLAERLGAAGPGWAERFAVRRCAARVDALYDDLLKRPSVSDLPAGPTKI
jgi:colanic acid/amylovoran biosynthesis glycosyltransferase